MSITTPLLIVSGPAADALNPLGMTRFSSMYLGFKVTGDAVSGLATIHSSNPIAERSACRASLADSLVPSGPSIPFMFPSSSLDTLSKSLNGSRWRSMSCFRSRGMLDKKSSIFFLAGLFIINTNQVGGGRVAIRRPRRKTVDATRAARLRGSARCQPAPVSAGFPASTAVDEFLMAVSSRSMSFFTPHLPCSCRARSSSSRASASWPALRRA